MGAQPVLAAVNILFVACDNGDDKVTHLAGEFVSMLLSEGISLIWKGTTRR